jgi:cellobiose-specific phosphotransferase system component IIB
MRRLPNFKIHKIVKDEKTWQDWLTETCQQNSWPIFDKSPMIWRELIDRGSKGVLIGDANDFQEYAHHYYGITSSLLSNDLRKISKENEKAYQFNLETERQIQESIKLINITISNPETEIVYIIISEILNGSIFGASINVNLRLYCEKRSNQLNGILMEIEDLASSNLQSIQIFDKKEDAFKDCDLAILFNELNELKDAATDRIFINPYIELAKVIDEYAKANCRILVTPFQSRQECYGIVNTMSKHLKRIDPQQQLIGNSLCDEMLIKAVLASRLKVSAAYIKNSFIIGESIKETGHFIDMSQAKVTDFDGAVWARTGTHWLSVVNMVADKDWIKKDFYTIVKERGLLLCSSYSFLGF